MYFIIGDGQLILSIGVSGRQVFQEYLRHSLNLAKSVQYFSNKMLC